MPPTLNGYAPSGYAGTLSRLSDCGCTGKTETSPNGLNGLSAPGSVVFDRIGASISDYNKTTIGVYDRLQWNWCNPLGLPVFVSCIDYDKVVAVIDCYVNLCTNRQIPEYDPAATADSVAIDKVLAACAGVNEEFAHYVMWEFYFGTVDGSFPGTRFLHPQTYDRYSAERTTPGDADTVGNWFSSFAGGVGDVIDVLKWVLILGLVGYGAWWGYRLYTTSKAATA